MSARSRITAGILKVTLFLGFGCGGSELLFIPVALPADVDLVDLAITRNERETHLPLAPPTARRATTVEVQVGDLIVLSGLAREDLDQIGAPSSEGGGTETLRTPRSGEPILPEARFTFSGTVETKDGRLELAGVQSAPRPLTADWCAVVDPCDFLRFETEIVADAPEIDDNIRVLAPLSSEEALLVLDSGTMLILEPRMSRVERLPILARPVFDDYSEDGEGLWLFRRSEPVLYHFVNKEIEARVDYPIPPVGASPHIEVAVARAPAPFEMFVIDEGQRLSRFDGEIWEMILELPDSEPEDVSMIWERPGEVVFSRRTQHDIIRVKDGRVMSFDISTAPRTTKRLEGYGTVVGAELLGLFYADGENWRAFKGTEERSSAESMRSVETFGDGILYGSYEGRVGVLVPGYGLCLPRPLPYWSSLVNRMEKVGDGVLITPGAAPVIYLRAAGVLPTPRCFSYAREPRPTAL